MNALKPEHRLTPRGRRPLCLRVLPIRPLHPRVPGSRVVTALAVSHLVVRSSFLTLNLCAIAAVPVQLKAVVEKWALYMVFYYLTRPPFAAKVGETLRCQLEFGARFSSGHLST